MIGFHHQNPSNNWPAANARLVAGTPVKMVFGVERCRETKATNPGVKTWYRWVGSQPLPSGNYEQHARQWLNQFIDGTFRREAAHVDYVQGYNETLANSQSPEEKAQWIALHTALMKVWYQEYRKESALSHIRFITCETAVGNDIPIEIARAAVRYDALLGYHPYAVCRVAPVRESDPSRLSLDDIFPSRFDAPRASFRDSEELYIMQETVNKEPLSRGFTIAAVETVVNRPAYVSPHDWQWYSGRWAVMDMGYAAQGVKPDWIFGEMGPVLDASDNWSGWLDPTGGWKSDRCLGGDINKYKSVADYWLANTTRTQAYQEGRVYGGVWFTSGAPGSGPNWKSFDLIDGDMVVMAEHNRAYNYPPVDGPVDPPDPPDPPPEPDCKGKPREQYSRRYRVAHAGASLQEWLAMCEDAYELRQTCGFSFDDAGLGALDKKEAILYGLEDDERGVFVEWFSTYYPGTVVKFAEYPITLHEIVDVVDELPKHPTKKYRTRDIDDITTMVVHHTVSPADRATSSIAQYHVSHHDWPGIGYHFMIGADGLIEQTNYLSTISYHASDGNPYSIGICLKGDFTYEQPTEKQLDALYWLINELQAQYGFELVLGHKEVPGNSTACPGATWEQWRID